ncbi:hypothetical protein Taro_019038 [Colocasia esculenta]|uniref:CCHC-type domain-containing protein n=1 Tax=Colocasia esculenta TaxID=4460 RepID=A0A843V0X7_COLES|nr:hypothetical protein [Colocasia esculenta]
MEMVQRAQLVEDTMAKVEGMRGEDISKPTFIKRGAVITTRTFPNNNTNNYNNNKRPTTGKDYGMEKKIKVEETMMVEYCKFCNKPGHQADKCWKKAGACLRCGSQEHRISNCPMLKDQVGRNQGVVKRQGRVNAVTQVELPEGGMIGRVEELLVAEELRNDHKKPFFFPFSSAATCTNHSLEVDQSFDLTAAHRMGYKLVDGVVTRELKGKAPADAEEDIVEEEDENLADDAEDDEDEDSGSGSHGMPGVEIVSDAPAQPSIRDFLAQLQLQMSIGFEQLNTRLDTVDSSLESLANTQVQLQLRMTRLQTQMHDTRQAPAPPEDDAA